VRDLTRGGAQLSIDALGSDESCAASVLSLRKRGRHVQVGLLPAVLGHPSVPMDAVIARELQLVGSHGMPAHAYDEMLALVAAGRLDPELLVTRHVSLDDVAGALVAMGDPGGAAGMTVMVQ
jgi:alcohol dehydrogenase